jgi:hypothetical protein
LTAGRVVSTVLPSILIVSILSVGKITDKIKEEFKGNIIRFIVDINAKTSIIDNLVRKFYSLSPLELKIEYEYTDQFEIDDDDVNFKGIDVVSDMMEFVVSLDDIDIKDEVTTYLVDVYKRAETLIQ